MTEPNFHQLLECALDSLSREEPVFQAEADLQLALAVQIKLASPDLKVRREVQLLQGKNMPADLVLRTGNRQHVIELKYPKQRLLWTAPDGEVFDLRFGANDIYRHGILKDISRVEGFVGALPRTTGSVVALTNASALWQAPKATGCDAEFSLQEGHELRGDLDWAAHTSEKVCAAYGRIPPFSGRYHATWKAYSNLGIKNGEFRYLAVPIEDGLKGTH